MTSQGLLHQFAPFTQKTGRTVNGHFPRSGNSPGVYAGGTRNTPTIREARLQSVPFFG